MKELADCVKGYVIPHEPGIQKTKERQKPSNIRVLRWVYIFNQVERWENFNLCGRS